MSPKTGRPPVGEKTKDTMIRVRMDPYEIERLDRCAEKMQATRSDVIREGVKLVEKQLAQKE